MSTILEGWSRDLSRAARSLLRAPGFTAIAVVTLALAIGANTAIFSVVDAVLLDPLAFPDADRLVVIRGTAPGSDLPEEFQLGPEFYIEYGESARGLEDLAYLEGGQTSVQSGDHVERLFIGAGPPSLYSTLNVAPVLGRLPTEDDEEGQVAVLSHRLWTEWFDRDEGVLGSIIEVSNEPVTIIGVMGPSFQIPSEQTSLWIHDLITPPVQPGGFNLNLLGRMAPGVDHDALAAELDLLTDRLPERFGGSPAYAGILETYRPVVRSLEDQLVGDFDTALWILLATVGIVLLIACANVANLMLVRAESRERDLAVRRAMGSGRWGLVRTQMAEALLLAVAGGAGGVILAWVGVPLVVRAAPESIPRLSSVGIDPSALLFTAGVAFLAAGLSGLLPALRASMPEVMEGLRAGPRVESAGGPLTRNTLVIGQTAAALILLVGSGLLLQSFRALRNVDPGYDTEDIFTFQMAPDPDEYGLSDGPSFARFHYMFMDSLAAITGVESVGLVLTLPLDEGAGTARVATEAYDGPPETAPRVRVTFAGGDYFQTMGIRLLSGRYFERRVDPSMETFAIVSRTAAERLWPGENPLGKVIRPAGAAAFPWITVGGMVEDVILADYREQTPEPLIYLPMVGPMAQAWSVTTPAYVVRTPRAERMAPEIRALIQRLTPGAPMYRIFTMAGLAARSMAQLSFTMLTLFVAAGLALVLGAIGLYGTLSYVVTRRTREIGIRMALGAAGTDVRRMVVRQGSIVALFGVVVGLVGAFFLTRNLESLLFEIEAVDPAVMVVVAGLMIAVALLASYVPARRASSVDPMVSLRAE